MSSRPPRKQIHSSDPQRRDYQDLDQYQYKRRRVESFYDEDQDYHFAEALGDSTEYSGDWFREASDSKGDTIDKMSENLDQEKRRAVRWRVQALRGIAIFNAVALIAGTLPCWVLMLGNNRKSIEASKEALYCDGLGPELSAKSASCIYYYHELSTFTAFVGLWLFGTLLQSLFMIFTSWKLHNKSFQAVVSLWTLVFMTVGLAVVFYTTTTLTLMDEPFNWRIAGRAEGRVVTTTSELRQELTRSITAFLGLLIVIFMTQLFWLWIIRQVLQYEIDLQAFGSEICGDDPVSHDPYNSDIPMEEGTLSNTRLLADDELHHGDIDIDEDDDELYGDSSPSATMTRNGGARGNSMGEFGEYDSGNDDSMGDGARSHGSSSPQAYADAQPPPANSLQSVMDLMANLTTTMSALHSKIDAIESRVGDGTALLVMPPGENQWDAKKPSSS